jgi:mannose-1-phosphate guanylyltransferase
MQVDYCYILSAGKGTRMGPVGEKLAKPLWPVFEKTLLELQVSYAQELGAKKIYINVHHLSQQVKDFIHQKKLPVELLYEPVLLDVGGAVHNLKRHLGEPTGNVLVINSDQFLFLENQHINQMLKCLAAGDAGVLTTTQFVKAQGYNALDLVGEKIVGVIKNDQLINDKNYLTYTGVALINLQKITLQEGVSNFFQSVCHPSQGTFTAYETSQLEYYDFGTLLRYCQLCFHLYAELKSKKTNKMISFLQRQDAIKSEYLGLQGYKSSERILNFTHLHQVQTSTEDQILIADPTGTVFSIQCDQ